MSLLSHRSLSPGPFHLADADMNAELIAHGYSNAFAGLFGGKNVMIPLEWPVFF